MALGSDESGEDFISGRVNTTNSTTAIWAAKADTDPEAFKYEFGSILEVKVSSRQADQPPQEPLTGFHSIGWLPAGRSKKSTSDLMGTGIGVRGDGGQSGGTGVLGVGGNSDGIGVQGIGGSHQTLDPNDLFRAGPGIMGLGGRESPNHNLKRNSHAAGIVGFGGAFSVFEPDYDDLDRIDRSIIMSAAGGAGVLGVGADMQLYPDTSGAISGPQKPEAGVIGIGGTARPTTFWKPDVSISAPGVIGISGRSLDALTLQTSGAGVFGYSVEGRGGVFASSDIAQFQLVPAKSKNVFQFKNSPNPREIESEGGLELPREGKQGDMFAMTDDNGQCGLWFCTRNSSKEEGAEWAPIVFGNPVTGTRVG